MYPAIKWWIFPVRYLHVYQRVPKWNILKSWPAWWFQHPWKIWKSVGIIKFPRYGKIKATFQTTNQWHFYAPKKHPVPPHICTYWDRGSSPVGRNNSTSPGSDTCELGSVTGGKKVGDKNWMRSNKNLSVCVSNFLLIYILILMNFAFCHSNWERLKFKKLSIGLKYRYVSNCIIPKIDRNHPLDNPRRK